MRMTVPHQGTSPLTCEAPDGTGPFVKRGSSREDDFYIQKFGASNRWYIPPCPGFHSLLPQECSLLPLMNFPDNISGMRKECCRARHETEVLRSSHGERRMLDKSASSNYASFVMSMSLLGLGFKYPSCC